MRLNLVIILSCSLTVKGVFAQPPGPVPANVVVWQLSMKHPPSDYQLQATLPAKDANGRPVLTADTRHGKDEWNSWISIPAGLLTTGADYTITVEYEVLDRTGPDNYFYVFTRSDRLGITADQWQTWHDDPGTAGIARLRVSPPAGDFYIIVGIHNHAAIRIRSLTVVRGSGWTTVPTTGIKGMSPPSTFPLPTGAQPFTVDAPADTKGPVLNLADFGAVADGNLPPATGPDRNWAAFKTAIARCRAVRASRLIVPKGIYRITSGQTIVFDSLSDFTFDGGGSTFIFHQIKGGAGMQITHCSRTVISHFNLDWDWAIDPLASVGRVLKVGPNTSFFEMRFETAAPLDPRRWVTMNPLDEKLRVPGTGQECGDFGPKKVERIDDATVRVWPSWPIPVRSGQLYLLRHYTYEKHGIVMSGNTHLSLQYVTIYSFPGIGFVSGGDQHHFELLHCRITFPQNIRRPITTTADGFHVGQSKGFIRLEDCDFGYMGDDCVNIHDNIHSGVRRVDDHTLVAENIVSWMCPYAPGDLVEIRKGDYSPTGFTGRLKEVSADYKSKTTTLVFEQPLPANILTDAILFNHRYGSHNCIIRNCYFHENRARGVLCNTADWLVEGNRFYHNQMSAMLLIADVGPGWSEGFGARNVIVRNNQFDSSNFMGAGDGAAIAVGATSNGSAVHYPFLENILFENNSFKEMPGPVIEAMAFKNLVVRNNRISNQGKAPLLLKMRGSVRAEFGSGLWLEGNVWTPGNGTGAPGLYYDAPTVERVFTPSSDSH